MNNIDKYSRYFTKDYLMGPNSFRLLEELLRRNPLGGCEGRVLHTEGRFLSSKNLKCIRRDGSFRPKT